MFKLAKPFGPQMAQRSRPAMSLCTQFVIWLLVLLLYLNVKGLPSLLHCCFCHRRHRCRRRPIRKVPAIAMCARVSLTNIFCVYSRIYCIIYYSAQSRNTWKCKHVQIDKQMKWRCRYAIIDKATVLSLYIYIYICSSLLYILHIYRRVCVCSLLKLSTYFFTYTL